MKLHFCPEDIELDISGLNAEVLEFSGIEKNSATLELTRAFHEADLDVAKFINPDSPPVVLVNDRHRPTPTGTVLEHLLPYLPPGTQFIVAVGTHPVPTHEEIEKIFGKTYPLFKNRISVHDANSPENLVMIGTSRDGFDFYINRKVMEASHIITINSIEPHYFAGFTGGRKSFLPGVASYDTITENHKFSLLPGSEILKLKGNPVHENMQEFSDYVTSQKNVFTIQVVCDSMGDIYRAYAGSLDFAFEKAIKTAREVYTVHLKEKADIVIAVALSPQSEQIARSFKALDSGSLALKEDGLLIMVCSGDKGIGNNELYDYISQYSSPDAFLQMFNANSLSNYVLGLQRIHRLATWSKFNGLWLVSNCPPQKSSKLFFRPYNNLDTALSNALNIKGINARIAIISHATLIIPSIS
ncbi:nickel-dependent lactate racemase [bacterium]|nr:nickel-dependent lactate racemase [bacterium]